VSPAEIANRERRNLVLSWIPLYTGVYLRMNSRKRMSFTATMAGFTHFLESTMLARTAITPSPSRYRKIYCAYTVPLSRCRRRSGFQGRAGEFRSLANGKAARVALAVPIAFAFATAANRSTLPSIASFVALVPKSHCPSPSAPVYSNFAAILGLEVKKWALFSTLWRSGP
jgi:hypothetical protein